MFTCALYGCLRFEIGCQIPEVTVAKGLQSSSIKHLKLGGKKETAFCLWRNFVFDTEKEMEGFLEANRVVEVSLTKLKNIHKSGDLPLRRTLLVSKALNKAQEVATSAHLSFLRSPPKTSSSKLLASISQDKEQLSSNESRDSRRPVRTLWKRTSPIASAAFARREPVQEVEPMDCVNSVVDNVLSETNSALSKGPSPKRSLLSSDTKKLKRTNPFDNMNTNSAAPWSTWQFDLSSPAADLLSPGKRNHVAAFPPSDKENFVPSWSQVWPEETKRFKPSTPESCPIESLPGFDGYLSPRNLQSAPLITYMLGGGAFGQKPSSFENGWPNSLDEDFDHFSFTHSSSQTQPILAC